MSLLLLRFYAIIITESEGNNMKRTRNSLSYRFNHFVYNIELKDVFNIIIEFITALALFGALFILPHILH